MIKKSLLILILIITACQTQQKENKVQMNLSDLNELINLPIEPDSVQWIRVTQGEATEESMGPTDYYLISVFHCNEKQKLKLKNQINESEDISEQLYLEKNFIKDWFPESVKNYFYLENDYLRIKSRVFEAKKFMKPPLNNGFFFMTDDNKVLLYMYTN